MAPKEVGRTRGVIVEVAVMVPERMVAGSEGMGTTMEVGDLVAEEAAEA